ncbi:hypothetical protein ABH955_004151 [Bacillus sp. RC240]|uniref:hypothetical protein n=1 Tax=Bacillus sp. RC240 TaxID=3156285 RepID=UPI0038364E77
MIPDVRFKNGYQELIEMRSLLMQQMDFSGLQEFLNLLYKDLDYYRVMADRHASLGLTDDARRVRRLERELQEVESFLDKFPFISLEKDGSITTTKKLELSDLQLLFNEYKKSFSDENVSNQTQPIGEKLDNLTVMVNELTEQSNKPQLSTAQQVILTIVLGLLVNFLSLYILPSAESENQTCTINQGIHFNPGESLVFSNETRIIFCNNSELMKEPTDGAELITQLHGMFVIKFISEDNDWILVEFNKKGQLIQGWLRQRSFFLYKEVNN